MKAANKQITLRMHFKCLTMPFVGFIESKEFKNPLFLCTLSHRFVTKNGHCNVRRSKEERSSKILVKDLFTTLVDLEWKYYGIIFTFTYSISWLVFGVVWWATIFYR